MAHFAVQAMGGFAELMYEGVIPERSVTQILEHRFSRGGATSSIANSRIVEEDGVVLGGLQAYPWDAAEEDPKDLLIPEARLPFFEPFEHLSPSGRYYINILAVYPEYRGRGLARQLMAVAEDQGRVAGFREAALHVFSENRAAVSLYEGLGYRQAGRRPLVAHPKLHYDGDMLLLTRTL